MALIEEVFKWTPEMAGVWVEVALTGLDFEGLGEPVQELWLPQEGPTETVYFTVIPRKQGISRLRYCIYYRQNLLQSFRMAARVEAPEATEPFPGNWSERLAQALGLAKVDAPKTGYLARVEYSLLPETRDLQKLPDRALSITANDNDGNAVLSIKGADLYQVRTNPELPRFVENVRTTLQDISTSREPVDRPDLWLYRFGNPQDRNAGDASLLKESLRKLANSGWQLYDAIVDGETRENVTRALENGNRIIHAAHVLLDKVIPWAALYDRKFDEDRQQDDAGAPIGHDACLAPIPKAGGAPPATACGTHAECPLHPANIQRRAQEGHP
ncbi:MAG: hypothetical protein L0170_15580, partial [Acidobacteria bacterium]|nr:hypothetical protein [Acidobacteriota bacterium]